MPYKKDKRVYVPNRGPYDYSKAEEFGSLVFCTSGNLDKFDVGQMYRELEESMRDALPDDYILLGSLTSLCCVACAIHVAKFQRLNLLIYKDDRYLERSIVLDNFIPTT